MALDLSFQPVGAWLWHELYHSKPIHSLIKCNGIISAIYI